MCRCSVVLCSSAPPTLCSLPGWRQSSSCAAERSNSTPWWRRQQQSRQQLQWLEQWQWQFYSASTHSPCLQTTQTTRAVTTHTYIYTHTHMTQTDYSSGDSIRHPHPVHVYRPQRHTIVHVHTRTAIIHADEQQLATFNRQLPNAITDPRFHNQSLHSTLTSVWLASLQSTLNGIIP